MKALAALIGSLLATGPQAHEDTHGHTAAIARPGKQSQVSRTVRVTMSDGMRFVPSEIAVAEGETVRFLVTNEGRIRHEFVLGTAKELAAHAEAMKKSPDM